MSKAAADFVWQQVKAVWQVPIVLAILMLISTLLSDSIDGPTAERLVNCNDSQGKARSDTVLPLKDLRNLCRLWVLWLLRWFNIELVDFSLRVYFAQCVK